MNRRIKHHPTLSTRPIGPNQVEVRVACRHAAHRVGWQLGETVTLRVAATATIGAHSMEEGCTCLAGIWARYRTPEAPVDLAGLVARFTALWARIEAQQRRYGFAVIDWQAACAELLRVA